MKLTTVYIPEGLLSKLDELVEEHYYPHRAEAIRIAIRLLVNEHEGTRKKELHGKKGEN